MKKTKITYRIFTGLLSITMIMTSVPDVLSVPGAVAIFRHLGYPQFLIPSVGVAKLLAVLAILAPGFPRLKEWANAGLVFDLTGAVYAGLSVGDPITAWLPVSIGYILIAASYIYYHKKMKAETAPITQMA
jgi:uncharacterized membrane protein YphA (DoxX/SURF4 family)